MRFSEAWLREWVNPPVDTQQLADQLSMAGLEVDAVEPAAPAFSGVSIGLVQRIAPHPDAAKLRICTVDLGQDEPLQIICGAANVAEGMKIPVATVGACLPGDFKIKKAKLRGVASFGMICSATELGLAETSDGILPLSADAPVGEDFRAWMALDDHCIEVDLTPDRGDCLGIAGLAREVAVINRVPLRAPAVQPVAPTCDDRVTVRLLAPDACPRYVCRVIRQVDPTAATPVWMQERLRRAGLRAISPVVDVTNYVMLELGQPMHGFDLAKLSGGIEVRLAQAGERLALLNGDEIELRADTLVIADANQAVAMAGIMGGAATGVGPETRDILLESAFFAPLAISGKARGYGFHTDSSHRFERGVDPQLQVRAIERATRLLLDIVGGQVGPVVEAVDATHLPRREPLHLREARVAWILGLELPATTIADVLERLGMAVERLDDGWRVTPPSARFDLVHEVDLIADIGRIHGYDNIPVSHASAASVTQSTPEAAFDLDRARLALVDRGFHEVITYSFVSPEIQSLVEPEADTLRLANPISAELSIMRTSLWAGLLQTARYNQTRQLERVRIFESGLRFRIGADGLRQEPGLAGLVIGTAAPEQWGQQSGKVDFYDLKADVEALLALTGAPAQFRFVAGAHPALHPGQTARIEREGKPVGLMGMLHPSLAAKLDLTGDAFLFELDLAPLADGILPRYAPISRFPGIRRDLAIVIDAQIGYERVADCVRAAATELLREVILFDVYTGKNVDSGRKSLALGLILQSSSQTLTEEIIEVEVGRILDRLTSELDARLRD
ncbi:phenylalanine--tRNA ligase subunit beta [Thiocystis violascens]|uniref:Phenylalanine--tRNA ligase beta subunit n=1 Tax=Thiocystis violascens (strain ATCC 17096 / DSM 198 / 6111) TaxID=765911 RepID=I3Y982_THIV6|nr:phenylalanine--tRNA ligase subunit beta [Thiocystis violascens]AFL73550.1 phenylalanyl-tRNA synthetase, beta subunit [Thiocystis violascens DSM 198]